MSGIDAKAKAAAAKINAFGATIEALGTELIEVEGRLSCLCEQFQVTLHGAARGAAPDAATRIDLNCIAKEAAEMFRRLADQTIATGIAFDKAMTALGPGLQ